MAAPRAIWEFEVKHPLFVPKISCQGQISISICIVAKECVEFRLSLLGMYGMQTDGSGVVGELGQHRVWLVRCSVYKTMATS
uniref:Uncharacterized protein n=1 Tax=Oryza meridionalis TaxID=40149 RepID=A0A0E0F320_9ORYZ